MGGCCHSDAAKMRCPTRADSWRGSDTACIGIRGGDIRPTAAAVILCQRCGNRRRGRRVITQNFPGAGNENHFALFAIFFGQDALAPQPGAFVFNDDIAARQ